MRRQSPSAATLARSGIASVRNPASTGTVAFRVRCYRETKYGRMHVNTPDALGDALFEVFEERGQAEHAARELQRAANELVRDYGAEEWRVDYCVEVAR